MLPAHMPGLGSYITALISLVGEKKNEKMSINVDFKTQRKQLTMTFRVKLRI